MIPVHHITLLRQLKNPAWAWPAYNWFLAGFVVLTLAPRPLFSLALLCLLTALAHAIFLLWSQSHSHQQILTLQNLRVPTALKKMASGFVEMPTFDLKIGDVIKVVAGNIIPNDGIITQGTTSIDESALTGEFIPLLKGKGEHIVGGTLNRDSDVLVQIDTEPQNTILERLLTTAEAASQQKTPFKAQMIKRQAAVVILAFSAAIGLYFYQTLIRLEDSESAFLRSVYVGLIPSLFLVAAVQTLSLGLNLAHTLKKGIVIKFAESFEKLARLQTLFFDKTGTLTKGTFDYVQMFIEAGTNQGQFLTAFFSLEAACNHPFAAAIESHPWYNEIQKAQIGDFKLHPGLGVCGTIRARDRREFFAAVGSLRFLKRLQMFISRDMKNQVEDLEAMGETVLLCGYDGQVKGIMSFSDVLRPHVRSVLNRIKNSHIEPAIVTGDSEEAVAHLVNSIGIKKVYSRCTPDEKAAKIQREVAESRVVGIVGSEEDDPECFKAAHVGISVDIGTRFSDTKNILLMGSDLRLVSWIIQQAQRHRQLTQASFIVSLGMAALCLAGLSWVSIAHLNILAALSLTMNLLQNVVTCKLMDTNQKTVPPLSLSPAATAG